MPTGFGGQQQPQQPGRAGSNRLPNGKIGMEVTSSTKSLLVQTLIWYLYAKQTMQADGPLVEMCPWVVVVLVVLLLLLVVFKIPQGSWAEISVLHRVWVPRNQQRR
jgi:hypothetical protein